MYFLSRINRRQLLSLFLPSCLTFLVRAVNPHQTPSHCNSCVDYLRSFNGLSQCIMGCRGLEYENGSRVTCKSACKEYEKTIRKEGTNALRGACKRNWFTFSCSHEPLKPPLRQAESEEAPLRQDAGREDPPLRYLGKCNSQNLGRPCGLCEGDCDVDSDCAGDLVCYIRDSKTTSAGVPIPGCSTNPPNWRSKDFCVDPHLYQCKDVETIYVMGKPETCAYVQKNPISRCKEYGLLCRETCLYCRAMTAEKPRTPWRLG